MTEQAKLLNLLVALGLECYVWWPVRKIDSDKIFRWRHRWTYE